MKIPELFNIIKNKSKKLVEDKNVAVKIVILNLFPIEYESKDVIEQHDEVKNFYGVVLWKFVNYFIFLHDIHKHFLYKDLKNLFIRPFKIFISINETFVTENSSFFILNQFENIKFIRFNDEKLVNSNLLNDFILKEVANFYTK